MKPSLHHTVRDDKKIEPGLDLPGEPEEYGQSQHWIFEIVCSFVA